MKTLPSQRRQKKTAIALSMCIAFLNCSCNFSDDRMLGHLGFDYVVISDHKNARSSVLSAAVQVSKTVSRKGGIIFHPSKPDLAAFFFWKKRISQSVHYSICVAVHQGSLHSNPNSFSEDSGLKPKSIFLSPVDSTWKIIRAYKWKYPSLLYRWKGERRPVLGTPSVIAFLQFLKSIPVF